MLSQVQEEYVDGSRFGKEEEFEIKVQEEEEQEMSEFRTKNTTPSQNVTKNY